MVTSVTPLMSAICFCFIEYPCSFKYIMVGAAWIVTYILAQTSFFAALKSVEASRLSSLLGTKIIALAIIAILTGYKLNTMKFTAVILCCISAVGMNFSGGKLNLKSALWVGSAVLNYALCDLTCTEMVNMMPGKNVLLNSFGVVAVSYGALGIVSLPCLFIVPKKVIYLKDAFPFGAAWFSSMIFLLTAFGSLGVVFGSIVQAGRGIISVLIGAALLYAGFEHLEPRVGKKAWIRRMLMALLMLAAMAIYAKA